MLTLMNSKLNLKYKYKTISVEHLKELQNDIDKLKQEGKLSDNETYRHYLSTKKFEIPESFPIAKSIIIIAVFTKLGLVDFHYEGKKHEVMIPPQYYDDGLEYEDLENIINNNIIKEKGFKIEFAKNLHLKLLAVRSGLGRYGRNNICYVDGMGSLLALYAYFTDYQFKEDNWNEIRMLKACEQCRFCVENCPTNAIPLTTEENFVIDAGKCIPLYNEIKGEFPSWINPDAHNALMGCMKCQLKCPANSEVVKLTEKFDDVTEEETNMILGGKSDKNFLKSLTNKLRRPCSMEFLPILKRNLSAIMRQI